MLIFMPLKSICYTPPQMNQTNEQMKSVNVSNNSSKKSMNEKKFRATFSAVALVVVVMVVFFFFQIIFIYTKIIYNFHIFSVRFLLSFQFGFSREREKKERKILELLILLLWSCSIHHTQKERRGRQEEKKNKNKYDSVFYSLNTFFAPFFHSFFLFASFSSLRYFFFTLNFSLCSDWLISNEFNSRFELCGCCCCCYFERFSYFRKIVKQKLYTHTQKRNWLLKMEELNKFKWYTPINWM